MKNKKAAPQETVKKVLRAPKFSLRFLRSGSEEAGTDAGTRLDKGEKLFLSMIDDPHFHQLRQRLNREAFIPWDDTRSAIELYIRKLALKDEAKAKELRIAQHEQYMAWVDEQTKIQLRHLKFDDDIELVLDEKGSFEEDHRPSFGTSYREREDMELAERESL